MAVLDTADDAHSSPPSDDCARDEPATDTTEDCERVSCWRPPFASLVRDVPLPATEAVETWLALLLIPLDPTDETELYFGSRSIDGEMAPF